MPTNFVAMNVLFASQPKVLADLHELEAHPDTHYADTYIPQSTKLLFASGRPMIL